MRDAKLLPDLAQIPSGRIFVLRHAGAADDFEVRDFGQIGQDFVLHAIGEEGVRFFFA